MQTPANPKIYHIVHRDRLPSIIADGRLWCDEEMRRRAEGGAAGILVERSFPWTLVGRIGVSSNNTRAQVGTALQNADHRPHLEVKREWYY